MRSKRTASRYTTESEQGTHSFEIVGYSLKKGIGVGKFIRSGTFAVGGYDWGICFYPDGFDERTKEFVSVRLEFLTKNSEAQAVYDLRLLNRVSGLSKCVCSVSTPNVFKHVHRSFVVVFSHPNFILRSYLEKESSGYIKDDCLTIECVLTVVNESKLSNKIKVPPSDLSDHFGKLLGEEEGADVTFIVGGEKIAAHKIVLATRSSVFKAELYGQMKEKRARRVIIEDMQPDVFRGLLHFIYTDMLPVMDDLGEDSYYEMIRLLLVAADRYAMDRMKLLCESILGEHLDVETVATTLALADQHNCNSLKDVCIQFISSSNKIDAVVATEGYADLKSNCPYLLLDVFEKACKFRRI